MIRIIEEALEAAAKPVPAEPKQQTRAKISSTLEPFKNDDNWAAQKTQIENLIKSVDTVQNILKNPAALAALQAGVDSIAFSMSESADPKKLKGPGWTILPANDEKAILNISEIRNWILDKGISMNEISRILTAIANNATITGNNQELQEAETKGVGNVFVSAVNSHTENKEITDHTVGHFRVQLNCPEGVNRENFNYIVDALYQQGRKGKGWNQFGSYERLLSVMTHGAYFPQDGSEGAGDITCGGKNIYAEVKCIDGYSLMTIPEIPAGGNGKNCLLMVYSKDQTTHTEFDVLVFRTQEMINVWCPQTKGKKEVKLARVKTLLKNGNGKDARDEDRGEIPIMNAPAMRSAKDRSDALKKAVSDWVKTNLDAISKSGNKVNFNDGANNVEWGMLQKNNMYLKKLDTLVTCCLNWIKTNNKVDFVSNRAEVKKLVSDEMKTSLKKYQPVKESVTLTFEQLKRFISGIPLE